jgi:hypothetical protein
MILKKTHAWFEYFVVGLFSLLVQIILNYFINKVGGLTYLANFNQCIEAIGITFCLTIFGLIVLSLRILTKQIFIFRFLFNFLYFISIIFFGTPPFLEVIKAIICH